MPTQYHRKNCAFSLFDSQYCIFSLFSPVIFLPYVRYNKKTKSIFDGSLCFPNPLAGKCKILKSFIQKIKCVDNLWGSFVHGCLENQLLAIHCISNICHNTFAHNHSNKACFFWYQIQHFSGNSKNYAILYKEIQGETKPKDSSHV